MIKKGRLTLWQRSTMDRKCLHVTSQKRALSHALSLAVNYRLFSHGDVAYRFNGKNDNAVLELRNNFTLM